MTPDSDNSPSYCHPFDNLTQVRIPGAVHQLGTQALMIRVFDTQTPARPIWWAMDPQHPPVDPVTYDVTLTFAKPETGRVVLRSMNL